MGFGQGIAFVFGSGERSPGLENLDFGRKVLNNFRAWVPKAEMLLFSNA